MKFELYLNETTAEGKTVEWNKFPVSRPLNKPVEVLINGKISKGKGVETKDSGGGILVGGKLIDSNSKVKWRYIS